MERTEISKHDIEIGDNLEMVFKTVGYTWIQAIQLTVIESKLAGDRRFNVHSITVNDDDPEQTRVIYKISVNPPPAGEDRIVYEAGIGVAIVTAITVIAGGLFLWLSLDKIYKLTEKPAGQLAIGFVAVVIGLFVFKALK